MLVGQGVELPAIDTGKQAGREWPDPIAGRTGSTGSGRQTASQRVVDHLLEWPPLAVYLFRDHTGYVRIERQRGTHDGIMMLAFSNVKMPCSRYGTSDAAISLLAT